MGKIKFLVMDVDGTLTDGKIYISSQGEIMKAFNVKDGYTIYTLDKFGITPIIITGRSSEIVAHRAEELRIKDLYQGVSNKLQKLNEVLNIYNGRLSEVAYIGDDYNDLDCIRACGFSACPADAESEIISEVDYVCQTKAGDGVVREFVKKLREVSLI